MSRLKSLPILVPTLIKLGVGNLMRVATYRLGLRLGIHPVLKAVAPIPTGAFFDTGMAPKHAAPASQRWVNDIPLFSHHKVPFADPPNWLAHPFHPNVQAKADQAWHTITDFDPKIGDIKTIWELSRMEWVIPFAQRAAQGSQSDLDRLNAWLTDWIETNPPYQGPNWKCGQEASIRVIHLATAAMILEQTGLNTPKALQDMVVLHLRRIAPTIGYAIGQANNHGTSEAAALFIGGTWMSQFGIKQAAYWARIGHRWLENRAKVLIEPDGTFSQYSVVYHRVMLDTYCLADAWRRKQNLPPFSKKLVARLQAATSWLQHMVDPKTGDCPNLGANDGARLIPLTDTNFRDFRPSLQLSTLLFHNSRAIFDTGTWDYPATWLGMSPATDTHPTGGNAHFSTGGFFCLTQDTIRAVLRYPKFRFRPSQADALHLDVWHNGKNILCDAGTFSYNSSPEDMAYFSGTQSHNTVQFDNRDQMPRLSRFLFGGWLQAQKVAFAPAQASAEYTDRQGAKHHRDVTLHETEIVITDTLSGSWDTAVLRWRMCPDDWAQDGNRFYTSGGALELIIQSDHQPKKLGIELGFTSLYYLQKSQVPVIEATFDQHNTVTTTLRFKPFDII